MIEETDTYEFEHTLTWTHKRTGVKRHAAMSYEADFPNHLVDKAFLEEVEDVVFEGRDKGGNSVTVTLPTEDGYSRASFAERVLAQIEAQGFPVPIGKRLDGIG